MLSVLILEDDSDLRNLYTRALKFKGFDTITAASSEEALDLFQNDDIHPDAAVLDMSMPGKPGSVVVEYIRQQSDNPTMPIIVISCDEDFRFQLHNHAVTFMTKPINLADLYTVLLKLTA
jgi:DNA-binding response OmpR family regulator